MDLVYRLVKGLELTYTEGDNNLIFLDKKVTVSTVAPAVTNDSSQNFTANKSLWIDITARKCYICTSASIGAAVWAVALEDTNTTYTDAEIKTKYENNADTNALTDAMLTKVTTLKQSHINADNIIGDPTAIKTLDGLLSHALSSGVMGGCDITDNLNGTVSFALGVAALRPTADAHDSLYVMSVPAQTNLALTDNAENWVYLDYNAGVPTWMASTSQSAFNCLDKCVGFSIFRSGNTLNIINLKEQNVDGNRKTRRLFLGFAPFIHTGTGTILGSNLLALTVTAGSFNKMLEEIPHDAFDTSVAGTANVNIFTNWYRNGTGGWTSVIESKTISTTTYDNNTGAPVTLDNNKYGVAWVYIVHNSPSKLHTVMGQVQYADVASARVATPPASIPPLVGAHGTLIGFVTYLKSATSFTNVLSAFAQTFSSSTATTHNGLSGLQGGTVNEYYHLTASEYSQLAGTTGTTALRPTVTKIGYYYFDTTLNKPIWWNGTAWTDSTGTVV